MAKVVTKKKEESNKAELPTIINEIFKLKIDRDTQELYIEELEGHGKFEEVTIRPLDVLNKIVAYNDDFEVTKESTLYRELKDAKDSYGASASDDEGKVCGRVVWNRLTKEFSDEKKAENKGKAKFYTLVFGIAYVKDKEPVLVDFRVGGAKFMEIINVTKKIKEEKGEFNKGEIKIKAHKNTDIDWPELEFSADFSRELPVTGLEPLFDTVEGYIEHHNEGIAKKAKFNQDKKSGKSGGFKKSSSFKRV